MNEIIKSAQSMRKGPKQGEHLKYLTNIEEMMLKRIELKQILASQSVQELDQQGNPIQRFDYKFKPITKRKCAINEFIRPDSEELLLPLAP